VCVAPRDSGTFISREAAEKFYRIQLGLADKHSPHSWRSAFSTICNDAGKPSELIEAQLDHQVGNVVASAYDRAQRIELRRDLLAWYEGKLIAARDGATVTALRASK
jgi:integrase